MFLTKNVFSIIFKKQKKTEELFEEKVLIFDFSITKTIFFSMNLASTFTTLLKYLKGKCPIFPVGLRLGELNV